MNDRVPPVDLDDFFRCTYTVFGGDGRSHLCHQKAWAVFEGPLGRLPRCARHLRSAQQNTEYRQVWGE